MKRSLFSFVCTVLLLSLTCSVRAASTYGILINSNRLVAAEDAGKSVDGHTQYLARVQLNVLDTIRLIDTSNNNATWMADLDAASVSGFEGSATLGYMVCMTAGCYDCYIKLKYQSDQLYIGAGTDDCSEGVEYNPSTGGGGTQVEYYLVGNSADMGEWSLENALLLTDGTISLDLQEGEYKFKVVEGRSWDIALGYANLNFNCSSYNVRGDEDGNVDVVLAQAGTLTVAVQNGQLCVTGNFVNNTDQVRLTTGVSPEGAGYISPSSGNYSIGSSVELSASIATGGWMFDRWSDDNSWGNPRTVTLTQDTTITAIFSPGEYGLLINGSTIVDGTFTGRVPEGSYIGQFKATTYLQQGDQLQIINLFHGDNSAWRPEIEDGGLSGNFEIGDNNLICNVAGCYDIYIKIHYGQSSDVVYIGEGYDCPNQGDPSGGNTGGDVLFSTSFEDWPSQTYSSEQTWASSNIIFTLNRVKVVPNQQPTSVSGSSVGYIQPTNVSSAYVYTDRLAYVERVVYTHASAISGGGWQLQSSSDGVDWYAFNDNETGCATSYQAEQKEVYVYMENVWLRWVPMGNSTNTNIYLTDIIIYGNNGSSDAPGIVASGDCAEDGSSNVTWLLSTDSILTIGGNGRMADYDEQTNIAPWYQYKDAYNSVYIADGVTNVGNLAFRESPNLRYVELASTVTQLGNYSFYNCPALHSLTLPESVTILSENTLFGGTTKMNSAVYNSRVFVSLPQDYSGEFAVADGTIMVASQAFRGCSQLTAVALPNTVTNLLGSSTFENCTSLMSVILPDGIIDLGQYAFSGCIALKGIDLPSTLASLGSYCFAECSAVDSIICRATTPPSANGSTFAGVPEGTTVYVPGASIETYLAADGWSTFSTYLALDQSAGNTCPVSGTCGADGENLTWVLGCDSVLTISGTGAMATYNSNTTPWLANAAAIKSVVIEPGVTSLSPYAFYNSGSSANYKSLTHVSIPSSISTLSNNQFWQCPIQTVELNSEALMLNITSSSNNLMYIFGAQVRKYILGDSVLTIGKYAFYNQGDDSLRTIVLPQGLTTISAWGFGYLEHLQSIEIPANVTSIGGNAFSGCTNLQSVVIGSGVTSIASQAFRDCNSLTRVTSNAPTPPTIAASDAFSLQDTLLVPCEAKTLYQQAQFWQNFSKIICPDDMNTPTELTYTLTADWQFIMLPGVFGLSADDIVTDGDVVWATYNAERRAAGLSGWEIYNAATGFSGTKAFIVRAADANATLTIHIPEQAREPAGAALPLTYQAAAHPQNANWNFLGNPYPYSYDIMAALNAQGIEAPITVWNGTGYSTYTPGIDEYTLQPFEAFFIQLPDNGLETITFSSEYFAVTDGATTASYMFDVDHQDGWTNTASMLNGYWLLDNDKVLTSPEVDLAKLSSIHVRMRTYGGTQYSQLQVTAGNNVLAIIEASKGSTMTDYEWTSTNTLTGKLPITFTCLNAGNQKGIGFESVTIEASGVGDDTSDTIAGALPGKFSVSATKQVQFSQGNLQYQASTNTWRFAENQYDVIGEANANISETYEGWIDLFGWASSSFPTQSTTINDDYVDFDDWGNQPINNGGNVEGLWRTLTSGEWDYLFCSRANADSLFSVAYVNGICGIIILPDAWVLPQGEDYISAKTQKISLSISGTYSSPKGVDIFRTVSYDIADWSVMESSGAIFLPFGDYRSGTTVNSSYGRYWSSTQNDSATAYTAGFHFAYAGNFELTPQDYCDKYLGLSVRLVR